MNDKICQDWEQFYDRDLNPHKHAPQEVAAFERHLTTCEKCQSRLRHLESLEADILAAWCLHAEDAEASRVSVEPSSDPGLRPTYLSLRRYKQHTLIGVVIAGSLLLAINVNGLWTNKQPPQYSDHHQPPGKNEEPAKEPTEKTFSPPSMPEIHVSFSEPTRGSKVMTFPHFSYVHVFPTVERIAKPYD